MKNGIILTLIPVFCCLLLKTRSQVLPHGETALSVVRKVIDARGGIVYLRSVKTFYAEMDAVVDGEAQTWITKEKIPNKGMFKIVKKGKVLYRSIFNGNTGFEFFNGKEFELDTAYYRSNLPKKNILTELDYLDSSLYRIELLQDEVAGGVTCYKLKGVFIDGKQRFLYINKRNFYIIKVEYLDEKSGEIFMTTNFSGFKKFGNFLFYTAVDFVYPDRVDHVRVKKVLINQLVTDADFNK